MPPEYSPRGPRGGQWGLGGCFHGCEQNLDMWQGVWLPHTFTKAPNSSGVEKEGSGLQTENQGASTSCTAMLWYGAPSLTILNLNLAFLVFMKVYSLKWEIKHIYLSILFVLLTTSKYLDIWYVVLHLYSCPGDCNC